MKIGKAVYRVGDLFTRSLFLKVKYILSHKHGYFLSTRTPSQWPSLTHAHTSPLPILLKLTFLSGSELWSGQCVKGLPLQVRALRKRIRLAVETDTGSGVNQESGTLHTLWPAHSCNKTLRLEVKKHRTARALKLTGSCGLDQEMRRLRS